MRTTRPESKNAAFTLTEILISVLIVCLLAALAFPVLRKTREAASSAGCVANLRTIGLALQQYAAENQGRFPESREQSRNKNGVRVAKPYLPDVFIYSGILMTDDYASPDSVWWCPGDLKRPASTRKWSYGHNQSLGGGRAATETWDGLTNSGYDPRYACMQAVEKPLSQIIFVMDFVNTADAGKWSSAVASTSWPIKYGSTRDSAASARVDFTRHLHSANTLFLDGHVQAMRFEDLAQTGDQYISPINP